MTISGLSLPVPFDLQHTGFAVSLACLDDLDRLAGFSSALCEETEGRVPDPPTVRAGVKALLVSDDWFVLVARAPDGTLAGAMFVGGKEWSDWANGLFWWVTGLYVLPEWRRSGAGEALFEALWARAKAQNPPVIGIKGASKDSNTKVHAYLASIGHTYKGYLVIDRVF